MFSFFSYSYFVDPSVFNFYVKRQFNSGNLLSSIFKETFSSYDQNEDDGKSVYIPDPNPLENKDEPLVYIYNSHQKEEYYIDLKMDYGINPSVMTASYILREKLNGLGVSSMVETTDMADLLLENNFNYADSYKASRLLLEKAIEKYPSLNYFIDLHRDSISYSSSTISLKDLSYAKVLFVIGVDHDGYEENEKLAKELSDEMNKQVLGISRGIMRKGGPYNNGVYNQDLDSNVILIEVGSSYNFINEVNLTMDVLAKSIKAVIG